MKTVDVVVRHNGWYVTRRTGSLNSGAEFFSYGRTKKERKLSEAAKDKYIKDWMEG